MSAFVPPRSGAGIILRLAFRDLRGGFSGFRVFLACLALGVAAIAGVGSLARGLSEGLAREGRNILGGDAAFSLIHREATPAERAALEQRGRVAGIATLRAMARSADGRTALTELKAVDGAYPMAGSATLDPPGALSAALAEQGEVFGGVADAALLTRLGAKIGDRLTVGQASIEVRAILVREPDVLSGGIGFGPRLLVGEPALRASGLLQPGSLVRWSYRVELPETARSDADLRGTVAAVTTGLPDAGFEVRTRTDAAPQLDRNVDRFTQFLTIVGLTALIVGGVGVANAVAAYLDRKRDVIATLKCLGATGGRVFALYLVEIGILASIGTAIGLALGAALPFLVVWGFGAILPLPITPAVYARELMLAAAYGLLTALAFALWPLGSAHDVPVAALYRERVAPVGGWPRPRYIIATLLATGALVGLSVAAAYDQRIALVFAGAAFATFVGLRLLAQAIMAVARRLPRPASTELRLAVANLHRPGALTPSVVLSLGLGLALLVALTLIDAAVRNQLSEAMPAEAPSFYFVDLPRSDGVRFDGLVAEAAPRTKIERVPMLRGTIVRVKGVPAAEVKIDPEMQWALRGDRGVTYAETLPENSSIVAGAWWPKDYSGQPLVSFEDRFADALGLKVGDEVSVNVLGRTITAKVASLRDVKWRTLAINFFMIFSPNTFAGAPHMDLATVTWPNGATDTQELGLLKRVTDTFPAITAVRVKEALAEVDAIVSDLARAIRAASSVTLIASVLVLAGALAAGHRQRLYDAVVLKTLGATRRRLLVAYGLEYALVGGITAIFGLLAGTLAAFVVAKEVMRIDFSWDWAAMVVAVGALVLTIALGLVGTWKILGEKPAAHLRAL